KRIEKSPAGYLVKSIEKDYAAPKGFTSRAERQRQAEANRQANQKLAEERRRKQQEEAQERDEQQEVDAYWKSLPADEQSRLEAEALANADQATRDTYESMKRMGRGEGYLSIIRKDYIRHLLKNRQPVEA